MRQIKRIAPDVYRSLGSGFSEDVYDRAMQVGFAQCRNQVRKVAVVRGSSLKNAQECCFSLGDQDITGIERRNPSAAACDPTQDIDSLRVSFSMPERVRNDFKQCVRL